MKNPSIDKLFSHLEKQILLAQSYSEVEELAFIIKACRLKPIEYLNERSSKIVLYRKWIDEFGNSLFINNNKRIKITINDLNINRKEIVCTDLYYGLSLEKVSKISKLGFFCWGKDEDTQKDCMLASFLGIDSYLRTYIYSYGEWNQYSSLMLGMRALKFLAKNKDIKYFQSVPAKNVPPLPCHMSEAWLTFLPAHKDFRSKIDLNLLTI